MSPVPESVIKHYMESRSLITVTREGISEAKIQGFILDYDTDWIALGYIYDFNPDGYLFLRRKDLTTLNCPATDAFQRHLLEADGVLDEIDFDYKLPGGGIIGVLRSLPSDKVVILEDENDVDIFLIGNFMGVEDDYIEMKCFSGAGRWDDEMSEIALEDVTSASYSSCYTLAYERYFAREQKKENKAR